MRTPAKLVLVLTTLASLSGCGTLLNVLPNPHVGGHPRIYGGVRFDVKHLLVMDPPLGALLALIDFPLSLVFDTLTLPLSIPSAVTYGDNDPLEKDFPKAVVEGWVMEGERAGHEVIAWEGGARPPGVRLKEARVRVFSVRKDSELPVGSPGETDAEGHYCLIGDWDDPWKRIRVECEGFEALELPVLSLHAPTDLAYWNRHRLLLRLVKR